MDAKQREKEEYELQHFNFTTDLIVEQNDNMIQATLGKALKVFTNQLIEQQQIPQASADHLRACISKIYIQMYDDCRPAISALSDLYRQTFTIPDNVLLPTDLLQSRTQTEDLVNDLRKEVQSAYDAMMQSAVFLASLDAEVELHEALESYLQCEEEIVEQLVEFQDQEVEPDEVMDLVHRLQSVGIIKSDVEQQTAELDKFLLQK